MKTKSAFRSIVTILLVFGVSSACSRSPIARKMQFMEAGRRLYDQGDYPRAILQFKNAVGAANGDPEPNYWLGLSYLGAGNIPLAIPEFRNAVALNPKHAAAQLRIGELLALSDNQEMLQEALSRLHLALNSSVSAGALSAIALTELKLGKSEEAHQHLEESLDQFPQDLSAYVILAKSNILKNDFPAAEAVLKKAVQAAPQSGNPLIALGDFYVIEHNDIEAEKLFRQAIALDKKKSGSATFELAMLEYRTGRKGEAEQLFKDLSTLPDTRYIPLHAIYLYKEGNKPGAVAEFEQLVRKHPNNRELRTQLLAGYWLTNRQGDVERVLNAALKENPKDFEALLQRGELYVAMGKYGPAQVDLDQALSFRHDSAVVHYIMAKLYQARGAELTYRKELSEAVRFGPDLLKARLELAETLNLSGPGSALKILDEAPAFQKRSIEFRTQRNWALYYMKELPELRQSLKQLLAVVRTPELLIQDGYVNLADRNYPAARASIEEALKKAPSYSLALKALADLYTAEKRPGDLAKFLKQYAQDNKSPEVQVFVGNWLKFNGDREGARAFYNSARMADPGFREADLALAVLDMEDGKPEAARSALRDLMKIRDQDVNLRRRSAVLESAAGNLPQAIAEYRQILNIDQNDFFALNNLAYLLANTNHPDEALAFAQRARELRPGIPQVEDTLGWVLLHKAIYGEAVSHLRSAAEKRPNDPVIQYHLGLAYWRSGDRTRGAQVLEAALRSAPNIPEATMARRELSNGLR